MIITKSISGFERNSLDTIRALRELRSRGVDVYFEQEIIHLQHAIEIYSALAQNENENRSHNIKRGITEGFRRVMSGYQNFACYGYQYDESKQVLTIVPKEATVVQLILELRLCGLSCSMICNELAKKFLPPQASPSGIGNAFENCFAMRNTLKWCCSRKPMRRISLPRSRKNVWQRELYYYKNYHEEIAPLEVFERVQYIYDTTQL